MPFAGYSNFEECVKKNQKKGNPEAYCGAIKHQVEGSQKITKAGWPANEQAQDSQRLKQIAKKYGAKSTQLRDAMIEKEESQEVVEEKKVGLLKKVMKVGETAQKPVGQIDREMKKINMEMDRVHDQIMSEEKNDVPTPTSRRLRKRWEELERQLNNLEREAEGAETSQDGSEHKRITDAELNKAKLPKANFTPGTPEDMSETPKEVNPEALTKKKEEEDKHPKTVDNPAEETGQRIFEEGVANLQKLSREAEQAQEDKKDKERRLWDLNPEKYYKHLKKDAEKK